MRKFLLRTAAFSCLICLLCGVVTSYAWRSKQDRYATNIDYVGEKGKSSFVEKGLPAPIIPDPEPVPDPNKINIMINGEYEYFCNPPLIRNNRTLLAFREIFEFFGMNVQWDGDTKKITATGNDIVLELTVDKSEISINGEQREVDGAPTIIENRTYVPIRFVSEALGYNVNWDSSTRTVVITGGDSDE